MADTQHRPNEPTEADVTRALCKLTQATLLMAGNLMGALEAGKKYFPPEAVPILDDLSGNFHKLKAETEVALLQVAA